jgi:hypothetical protein
MLQFTDPEEGPFYERRTRQGELVMATGLVGLATWLAAALPSQHETKVNIWPPIVLFGVLFAVGVYVMVAAENKRWPLPGRSKLLEGSDGRAFRTGIAEMTASGSDSQQIQRLTAMSRALDDQARALRGLGRGRPLVPPLYYQREQASQAVAKFRQNENFAEGFDALCLTAMLDNLDREGIDRTYEPLDAFLVESAMAALVEEGVLIAVSPRAWAFPPPDAP